MEECAERGHMWQTELNVSNNLLKKLKCMLILVQIMKIKHQLVFEEKVKEAEIAQYASVLKTEF